LLEQACYISATGVTLLERMNITRVLAIVANIKDIISCQTGSWLAYRIEDDVLVLDMTAHKDIMIYSE